MSMIVSFVDISSESIDPNDTR